MADDLDAALAALQPQPQPGFSSAPQVDPNAYNPWSAAGKSMLFSMGPGMFGMQSKDPEITQFQNEHPYLSTTLDLLSGAGEYGFLAKQAEKIPAVAKAIEKFAGPEKVLESPFAAGAMKTILSFAPVEAGRLATSALLGDQLADWTDSVNLGVGQVAKEAVENLALGGFVGGAFEKLGSGGGIFRARRTDLAPGANLDDPVQLQIRDMQKALASGTVDPSLRSDTLAQINRFKNIVVNEEPPFSSAKGPVALKGFSSQLAGNNNEEAARAVNGLWKPNENPEAKVQTYRLVDRSLENIGADQASIASAFGLPQDWQAFMQIPRLKVGASLKSAKNLQGVIQKYFDPVESPGLYVARDGDAGLFVMAKKLGDSPDAAKGDKWLIFKTDSPGVFAPNRENWAKIQLQRNAWLLDQSDLLPRGGVGAPILDDIVKFNDQLRAPDYRAMVQDKGNFAKLAEYLGAKVGIEPGNSESLRQLALFAKKYVAPAMFQFTDNPLAAKLFSLAKLTYDRANALGNDLFYGETRLAHDDPLSAITSSASMVQPENSLNALTDKAYNDPVEWAKVHEARMRFMSPQDAVDKLGIGPDGLALLKELERVDNFKNSMTAAVEHALGIRSNKQFAPIPNHYGISNRWKGDNRVPVYSDTGKLIGVGGGVSRSEAIANAQRLQAKARTFGIESRLGQPVLKGELSWDRARREDIAKAIAQDQRIRAFYQAGPTPTWDPHRYKEAKLVKGFIGEDAPWTKQEFKENVLSGIKEDLNRQAELTVKRLFARQFTKLNDLDPETYAQLMTRLRQMEGKQGPVGAAINQAVDKVLGPIIGKNSASKIVGTFNSRVFDLTLGFGNLGYALTNLLTFTQTALPHLAFLTTAAPQRVAKYYTYWPLQGIKSTGSVGLLDIFKLTAESFRLLGNPEKALNPQDLAVFKEHWTMATRDGVWDPKFVENFAGENAINKTKLKATLSGADGFGNFIKAIADFTPGLSEKFARGHTFVLGWTFGKNIVGLEGEHLYQFAKEFNEKTQFNFSTADRPLVITGPFGNAIGLFKNWMMHYIGWWLQYMGEGFHYGNWKPLLWMTGAAATAGGIGAIPFFEPVNDMSKFLTNKSLMQHTYATFGGDKDSAGMGDAVYYGLPALLGFSIQGQVSMPFADPGQTASQLFSLAYIDRMKAFGAAAGEAYDHLTLTGQHPATDPHVLDNLIKAFAPKAIYRASSVDWNSGAIKSLSTGNELIDGLPPAQRMLYTMGLNPRTVDIGFRVAHELFQDQQKRLAVTQQLGQEWADAEAKGRYDDLQRIVATAVVNGVDVSSVIKSGKGHLAKGREAQIERQFSPKALYDWRTLNLIQ